MEKLWPYIFQLGLSYPSTHIIKVSTHMGCSWEVGVGSILVFNAEIREHPDIRGTYKLLAQGI
jgi:hypothetical protein